jgi:predicted heme/steroid binding protein
MADQRRGGKISFTIDGEIYDAKGEFSYGLGTGKKTAIVGADRTHGFKEEPQVAFIEGKITDRTTLDLAKLAKITGATVTLELANHKAITLREAWYAGDAVGHSDEGEIDVRFEANSGDEIS